MKKTAIAAFMLSCCAPFSASASGGPAGDYGRMDGAFQQNLETLRQLKKDIDASTIPWTHREGLLDHAVQKLEEAKRRKTDFDAALASVKTRNPNNAQTGELTYQMHRAMLLTGGIKVFAVPELKQWQEDSLAPLRALRTRLCGIYAQTGGAAGQTFRC